VVGIPAGNGRFLLVPEDFNRQNSRVSAEAQESGGARHQFNCNADSSSDENANNIK